MTTRSLPRKALRRPTNPGFSRAISPSPAQLSPTVLACALRINRIKRAHKLLLRKSLG